MPRVDSHLHYRSVDVSSIKELARRWYPRIYFNAPEKNGGHRALADILESIRELDYYRSAVFVPAPGPTTEDVQAISTATVDKWGSRL
jgi:oligoribonuclease